MKTRKHSATLLFICFICLYFIYLPYLFILFALFTYHATTLKTNIRLSENTDYYQLPVTHLSQKSSVPRFLSDNNHWPELCRPVL